MTVEAVDLVAGEWAATRRVRGLEGEYKSWSSLLPLAQFELARWESALESGFEPILRASATSRAISAARILDLASQSTEDLTPGRRLDTALLASLAYALHGNYPAAGAVVERLKGFAELEDLPALYIAALGSASPRHLGEFMRLENLSRAVKSYLEAAVLLQQPSPPESERLRQAAADLLPLCQSAFEMSLVGLSDVALSLVRFLNLGSAVREAGVADEYVEALSRSGVATLMPPQLRAVKNGLLRDPSDAVIALPTSTGKTLLGELCLATSLGSAPGLAVYLSPYVALGSQVRDSLQRHLPRDVRVHGLFGGYQADAPLEPWEHREILVATPERFDALLRNSPRLHDWLRCVVIDEAHHLGDAGRGLLVESLLARLKLVRSRTNRGTPRLVMMSAVVSNVDDVARWLGGARTFTDSWRPAAQRIGIWTQEGRILWFPGRDAVTAGTSSSKEVLGRQELPWPRNRFRSSRNYGEQNRQRALMAANVAYLCKYLAQRYDESVLCVCATRATSRAIAAEAAEIFDEVEPIPEDVLRITELIEQRHRHLRPLASFLRRGVAYHNASLPVPVRGAIERAARRGALNLVSATTTLAEGVDLPFRYTVVADWLMWGDWGEEPLSPLLFSNIAGRSGRAGMHTEGETVIVDNPVGNPALVAPGPRGRALRRIIGLEDEPRLTSALSDSRALGIPLNRAVLASQFLAAVPENPDDAELVRTLAKGMFGVREDAGVADTSDFFQSVREDLLSDERVALATAASPITLTETGVVALHTGLSPGSFRDLLLYLQRGQPDPERTRVEAASDLLRATWHFPEQTNRELRKSLEKGKRGGIYLKDDDIEFVVGQWLSGEEYLEIFVGLPGVAQSKRGDRLEDWLDGQSARSSWYDVFEKFTSFINDVLVGFLPWMCRAASTATNDLEVAREIDWATLAFHLEVGVDTTWAANVISRGAPVSRRTVAEVGRRIVEQSGAIPDLGLGEAALLGIEVAEILESMRAEEEDPASLRELDELDRWLSG